MFITNNGSRAQAVPVKGGSVTVRPGQTEEVENGVLKVDLKDEDTREYWKSRGVKFSNSKSNGKPEQKNDDTAAQGGQK